MTHPKMQRLLEEFPPEDDDNFMLTADGVFHGYKRTERAANMLMKKLADTGKYSVVEWVKV